MTMGSAGIAWLRDAAWLSRRRAIAYSKIAVFAFAIIASAWIYAGDRLIDPRGKPVGADFVSFWAASALALGGTPASVYDPAQHRVAEQGAVGRSDIPYYAWFYPPVFLLLVLPLALVPYGWSLAIWLSLTGAAYAAIVRRLLPAPGVLWPAFGFPAALFNVMHGQNAFLTVTLFGGGILLLDRRPILAGALLGTMAYKPQLGCLIPLALLASGRWTAIAAAFGSAALLVAASFALFGTQTFVAFLAATDLARRALEDGLVDWDKMESLFAGVRLLGGSLIIAYAAQALLALAAAAAVIVAWRGRASTAAKGAVLAIASLLFSPFLLEYDLVLLAIPIAWLTWDGARNGFLPWEKASLALAWLVPLVSRPIASLANLGIAPLVCGLLLVTALRRALREAEFKNAPIRDPAQSNRQQAEPAIVT
jgi:alpha-1,2-mannosyltransferase